MSRGPNRPMKTRGPPDGLCGTAHIEPTSHGPWLGLAHQFSGWWAVTRPINVSGHGTRPGPSNFCMLGRDPTPPITFSKFHGPAKPDPLIFEYSPPGSARIITKKNIGPVRPGPSQFSDWPGPAQTRPSAHDQVLHVRVVSSSWRDKHYVVTSLRQVKP